MTVDTIENVELVHKSHCILGEGPAWSPDEKTLYYIDIFGKRVKSFNIENQAAREFAVPSQIGAVIPTDKNSLLLLLSNGIFESDKEGLSSDLLFDIPKRVPENRMNDAKCDAFGRLWAGTLVDGVPHMGSLFRIEGDEVIKVLDDLTISNGLAWSLDSKKMYFIDSGRQDVQVGDFDLDSGSLTHLESFVAFPEEYGIPDGMTSDLDGGIWVAFFGGGKIRRYDQNAKLTHEVIMPVPQVTSCAFGGEAMNQLFVTTANIETSTYAVGDLGGSLFMVETEFMGAPTIPFKRN